MENISIMGKIDEKDLEILRELERDCSQTKKKIARKLGLPLTTVHNRVAKLEKEKIISSYRAKIDYRKLGFGISAFVQIIVDYPSKDYSQEDAARKIRALPGVEAAAIVAGGTDIIAKVRAKDTDGLNDFLLKHLRKIAGVDKTTTLVVLKEFE